MRQTHTMVTSSVKRLGLFIVLMSLALVLTSCFGHWFTPPMIAKLIVSDPIRVGGKYEVLISVTDMPDGGIAGIQLGTQAQPAITFTNVDVATITTEGLNGFQVTSQTYTAGPPATGCLIAVNGAASIESGTVLKLSFEVTGDPTVTLDEGLVSSANGVPAWIFAWNLATDIDYYTK
ncbi:hypothetical protein ACFLS5_03085 [Candidatus Bipolaricaulota bacterium]